ncbi:MAG TPA: carboxypeptidase-like regulatory domain-containing protein, partial [Candidatus Angelobacter sp.]
MMKPRIKSVLWEKTLETVTHEQFTALLLSATSNRSRHVVASKGGWLSMALKRLSFLPIVSCLLLAYSPSQTTNGLITGAVTDASGAFLPGAQVNVTNLGTGLNRATTTNSSG